MAKNKPESDRCQVHDLPLEEGTAKMKHDMFRGRAEYFTVSQDQFPNANTFKLFGSPQLTAGEPIPKYVEVRFCPECRKTEKRWKLSRIIGMKRSGS